MQVRLVPPACLLLALACGGRSAEPAPAAPAGRQTLEHDGRTRSYLLRVPPSRAGDMPLVIVLHGGGGNADNAEMMTGFTELARAEGFVVVYPEGTALGPARRLTWNAGHCCGYAMRANVDDVGFLRALIDHLVRRLPIDPRRVYVTGMSNGAMMSHRAGLELPDRVAAIAPVVGGIFGDERARAPGVSAIMINGVLDRNVPYEGGPPGGPFASAWDGTPVRPALDQARFWAAANGCDANAKVNDTGPCVHVRYECPDGIGVELYAVADNGHAWPGGRRGSAIGDPPSRSLDASRVIWEFFARHPRR